MNRRRVVAGMMLGSMVGSVVAASAWRPTRYLADSRPKVVLETLFPASFNGWAMDRSGPVQLVSPSTEALLNQLYDQTLSRVYVGRAGERIMLSVAYGGDQSDATRAHRPDVCYPAQGFEIRSDRKVNLEIDDRLVSARVLDTKRGPRREPVTYWVAIADRTMTTGTEQKLAQLRFGLRGIIPDGMLVRVSNISNEPQQAYGVHLRFLRDLAAAVDPLTRTRIFGANQAATPPSNNTAAG